MEFNLPFSRTLKEGHQSGILSSHSFTKRYMVSGGAEGRLVIWNTETGKVAKLIELGQDEVRQVLIMDSYVITGGNPSQYVTFFRNHRRPQGLAGVRRSHAEDGRRRRGGSQARQAQAGRRRTTQERGTTMINTPQ